MRSIIQFNIIPNTKTLLLQVLSFLLSCIMVTGQVNISYLFYSLFISRPVFILMYYNFYMILVSAPYK